MVATFDGLNRFETPMITLCRPSSKFVDGVATAQVGILTDVTDQEIIFNFNAPSELNFRVTQVIHDELPEEERLHILEMFRKIEARRLLYVQDIGYFMITSVQEDVTENVRYKDVTAETCEQEMANKGLPYIEDGTYQFRDLLETVIAVTPKWTIGDIDENIAIRYRTFEDVSTEQNVLAFLMQDMQDAYECIFLFDIQNRIINVYDQANYVRLTDIHITHKDFMEHLDVTYNTDDLYTAITVFGDEDLNINAVNPLGTGTIYNFDHYIDWMSPELGEKVSAWQDLIESVTPDYYDLNMAYYGKLTDRSMAQHELDRLNIVLTMYQRARENTVAQASLDQIASYNAVIIENGGTPIPTYQEIVDTLAAIDDLIEDAKSDIADVEAEIASLDADIASILVSVNAIRNQVAISTYFTEEEYEELSDYIFEGEYTDEYVTVTESMDYSARFRQMKLLYDRAVVQLEKISVPTQEFSVDVENFIFHKDFQPWTNQLETGCLINVEVDEDDVAQLFLSTITVNYEDLSLSMKFGNRYNKFDPESLFKDALGNLRKTANSVNYLRDAIYPIKNGELDYMQQEIENSRTLTKNAVLAARNETVVIDDTGYTGRRIDPDTGEYDPKQIKITGRNIVFTDDAWDTAKTALGEIMLPGSQETTYGINAETVIGNLIVGQELRIINSSGEDAFVESDNAVSTVVVEYALSDSTTTAPSSGWSEVAPEWEDGKYMWQRTTTEYADGHQVISDPTCIAGAAGKDGQDGTPGQDGADGLNNAVVSLYKRSATAAAVDWTDTLTYSFRNAALISVPTGWSETIPAGTDPVYMTAATASSSSLTDTIAYTEWATPILLVQNGEDGAPGAPGTPGQDGAPGKDGTNGLNSATVILYQRAESAASVTKPTVDLTYTFATGVLSGTLAGWSQEIPATDGNPCFVIQATAVSSEATDTITASEWSEVVKLVEDGIDGTDGTDGKDGKDGKDGTNGMNTAVVYLYKRSATAASVDWTDALTYSFADKALTSTPSGWSETIPSGTDPIYITAATAASVDATDTIAYTEWAAPVVLAQNGENGEDGQDGAPGAPGAPGTNGTDGSNAAAIFLYQRAENAAALSKPTGNLIYTFATGVLSGSLGGWAQTIPATDGNPCFSIQATAISTEATDTILPTEWSDIVKLVEDGAPGQDGAPGAPGTNGTDGINTAIVYLYKRSESAVSVDWTTPLTYNFANKSLTSVPTGWSETIPSGTNPIYITAATAASANATDTIDYTEWAAPVVLAQNGQDGEPGQDGAPGAPGTNGTDGSNAAAVFLYQRAENASSLSKPSGNLTYTFATGVLSGTLSGWTQTIPATDGNPCFSIQATAISTEATDIIAPAEWSDIVKLVEDGAPGQDGAPGAPGAPGTNGMNTAIVYLYKRSDTTASIDWTSNLTYSFSDKALTSVPSGWYETIPGGTDPIYVTAATAASNTATDTIPYTEWATPVILAQNGENGEDGAPGTPGTNGTDGSNAATVFLYARAEDASSLSKPTGNLTYTFATGALTGTLGAWSQTIPASNGKPCFVIQATAISAEATDTIQPSEWSNIVKLVEDGTDGINGTNGTDGRNSAVVYLYKRAASATIDWSNSLTYDFTSKSLTTVPTGWSETIPAGTDPIFITAATASSTTNTDTIAASEWATPVVLAQNGENGQDGTPGTNGTDGYNAATVFLYQRSASETSLVKPTATLTYTFATGALSGDTGTWAQAIPATDGNPCYMIQATAISTDATDTITSSEWSGITKILEDGVDGAPGAPGTNGTDGRNAAVVYLYKRAASATIDWSEALTYSFADKALTSVPTGWSETIPAGTEPIFITAATASSATGTDTILASEWASPVILAQNGENGEDGAPGAPGTNGTDGSNAAAVFLYKRAETVEDISKPTSELTYTFATGVLSGTLGGWSQTIPATDGNPCFVIQATAISTSATDTISASEWSEIVKLIEDGAPGQDGAPGAPGTNGTNGMNSAMVYLYKRSSVSATIDWTNSLTYSFADKALTSLPTGWFDSIPAGTDPIYVTAATASSAEATDTIAYTEWATPVIMAQNGEDGAPGAPGTPGTNGTNGSNAATVFLYQRAESATGLVKPTTTLTYTFATGTLTGTLGDWSQTIPENNGNPLYIIQATAVSTDTTDEILASEWSEIRELVQDGTDGAPGADGINITDIEPEYYLSSSQAVPTGGEWLPTCPAWTEGMYIWTRSRITWEDGSETTTEPVLDTATNAFGEELVRQSSEIIANADGIRENFEYYSELNGEVEDIRAYVQTGYLGEDSSGNQLYGVRIGKTDGDSDFSSMFTTDEVGFYDGTDKLAFLSNKKLNVSDGRFTSIEMTDDISDESRNKWRITCDTGYTIKYVG